MLIFECQRTLLRKFFLSDTMFSLETYVGGPNLVNDRLLALQEQEGLQHVGIT